MKQTLPTDEPPSQDKAVSRIIFTIDHTLPKIVSIARVVDSDEQEKQLEPWIETCVAMAGLIRPSKQKNERAAA